MDKLQELIFTKFQDTPTLKVANDLLLVANRCSDVSDKIFLAETIKNVAKENIKNRTNVKEWNDLFYRSLLCQAPYDFDSFMIYIEKDRPIEKQFYLPRRKTLKRVVDALNDIVNDKLDELFISMPPRVGKSSTLVFFMSWILGRDSELANLYVSFSDKITSTFYSAILEILEDTNTYKWHDVFPLSKIASTNAKDETIDIDRKKHYKSVTCRSIDGTLNGACDVDGVLIADDLVSGIEEALSKERLATLWSKVSNDMLARAKKKAKMIWVGTRWSIKDPEGLRMAILENDPTFKDVRYKIINLPALDENGLSNFEYKFNVGFDTSSYLRTRAMFEKSNDIASWNAQYMGNPIEREGTVINPNDIRTYNGILPEYNPDRIFMAIDPSFGGGDFTSAPICYQYGKDVYVVDVVYTNLDKTYSEPQIVEKVLKHNVQAIRIEANNGGTLYRDDIDRLLRERNYKCNITTRYTTRYYSEMGRGAERGTSKTVRIYDKAPDIIETFIFLDDLKRDKDYSNFMANVFSFTINGKNKHDDAIDSLVQAQEMVVIETPKISVVKRFI